MSAKNQHSAEKRLKSYARRRQRDAHALGEIPFPMRRTLQAEVSQTFQETSERPAWVRLWPRFAILTTIFACALVTLVLWQINEMSSSRALKLAQVDIAAHESGSGSAPAKARSRGIDALRSANEAPPTDAQGLDLAQTVVGASQHTQLGDPAAEPAAESPPIAFSAPMEVSPAMDAKPAQPPAASGEPDKHVPVALAEELAREEQTIAPRPAAAPSTRAFKSESVALASPAIKQQPGQVGQPELLALKPNSAAEGIQSAVPSVTGLNFTQRDPASRYRKNFNSPPFPNVLRGFELRIQGTEVRILDRDGSVYEGSILADEKDPSSNLRFRASGQNQTLNQAVVFSGRFIDGADASAMALNPSPAPSPERSAGASKRQSQAGTSAFSSVEHIEGTVRIGDNTFTIEAVQNKP